MQKRRPVSKMQAFYRVPLLYIQPIFASPSSLSSATSRGCEAVRCHWIPVGLNNLQGIFQKQIPISCWFLWSKRTLVRLSVLLSPSTETETAFADREKMESRWEVGKQGMRRTQKTDSLPLQIILLLSMAQQNTCFACNTKKIWASPRYSPFSILC